VTFDLFFFWRQFLGIVLVCYCAILTIDRVVGYWRVLHGSERHWGYVRKYLAIQLLRVNWRDVRWELAQIAFWLVVLAALVAAHAWLAGPG